MVQSSSTETLDSPPWATPQSFEVSLYRPPEFLGWGHSLDFIVISLQYDSFPTTTTHLMALLATIVASPSEQSRLPLVDAVSRLAIE